MKSTNALATNDKILKWVGAATIILLLLALLIGATQQHNAEDPVGGVSIGGYVYPTSLRFGLLAARGAVVGRFGCGCCGCRGRGCVAGGRGCGCSVRGTSSGSRQPPHF